MNLIVFAQQEYITADRVRITGERATHLHKVLKAQPGDTIACGQLYGLMGYATVIETDAAYTVLEPNLTKAPPKKLPVTLIVALPRPKVFRRLVKTATEMGVAKIIFFNAYKVEKSYWQSPLLSAEKVQQTMLNGLQQVKDTVPPDIEFKKLFRPFVEDELPALAAQAELILAHPDQSYEKPDVRMHPCLLMVGPEGGFIPFEIELINKISCTKMQLGERIFTVENAVISLLSKLCRF